MFAQNYGVQRLRPGKNRLQSGNDLLGMRGPNIKIGTILRSFSHFGAMCIGKFCVNIPILVKGIPILAGAPILFSANTALATPSSGPAVPTLVQHVATGMDRYPVTTLAIKFPNPAGAGNALILGVQFNSAGAIGSVSDNEGNAWLPGPTVVNTAAAQRQSLYYCLNAVGGTQNITVTFTRLGTTNGTPQAVLSEWYKSTRNAFIDPLDPSAQ